MSLAASTIPGRTEPYKVNGPQSDVRLVRRPRKILRRVDHEADHEADHDAVTENGEPLVNREDFHKEFGRGRGFSYVFTANEDEKAWNKSKPIKSVKIVVDEEVEMEKLKKERKFGKESLVKTWSRNTVSKRPLSDRVGDPQNKKKQREDYRKFMNLGPRKPKDTTGAAHKALMANDNAEMVAEERRKLLEMDRVSRKRIKQLEEEIEVLKEGFESVNRENEQLRKKLNSGDQVVIETYQRVYEDRHILRQSEASYKARISSLDSQLKELQKDYDKQQKELTELKQRVPSITQQLEAQSKVTKSYWDGKSFREENSRLRKSNEQLKRELEDLRKSNDLYAVYTPNTTSPRSQRNVSGLAKLPELRCARSTNNKEPDPPRGRVNSTNSKTKETVTIKKQKKEFDSMYNLRQDFMNMMPDYFSGSRHYKLRSY